MLRLRSGYGYWETDRYPIGGSFRRAPADGLVIVKVLREFKMYHGANREGLTADGRKVAFDFDNTAPANWECPGCGSRDCPGCAPHPSQQLSCFV